MPPHNITAAQSYRERPRRQKAKGTDALVRPFRLKMKSGLSKLKFGLSKMKFGLFGRHWLTRRSLPSGIRTVETLRS